MGLPAVSYDHCRVVIPSRDPDAPDPDEERAEREAQYVHDWCHDNIVPEALIKPLYELIEEDSGLLQTFLDDYENGDNAEFEQSSGDLARALREHVRRAAV